MASVIVGGNSQNSGGTSLIDVHYNFHASTCRSLRFKKEKLTILILNVGLDRSHVGLKGSLMVVRINCNALSSRTILAV